MTVLPPFVTRRSAQVVALSVMFLCALALRIYVFLESDNHDGAVPMGWLLDAYRQIDGFGSTWSWTRPPGYTPIIAALLKFWPTQIWVARFFSVVCGALTVFPLYGVTRMYWDQRVGLVAASALAVYPLHLYYSVLTVSDVAFGLMLLTSIYCVLRWKQTTSNAWTWWSAAVVTLSIACSLRFEGWLIIPFLAIYIAIHDRRWGCGFLLSMLVYPTWWFWMCQRVWGDPLLSFAWPIKMAEFEINLAMAHEQYHSWSSLWSRTLAWPNLMHMTMPIGFAVLGIVGVLVDLVLGRRAVVSWIGCTLFVLSIWGVVADRLYMRPRYSLTTGLLLLPAGSWCLVSLVSVCVRGVERCRRGMVRSLRRAERHHITSLLMALIPWLPVAKGWLRQDGAQPIAVAVALAVGVTSIMGEERSRWRVVLFCCVASAYLVLGWELLSMPASAVFRAWFLLALVGVPWLVLIGMKMSSWVGTRVEVSQSEWLALARLHEVSVWMVLVMLFIAEPSIQVAYAQRPQAPAVAIAMGEWFAEHATGTDRILLDVDRWQVIPEDVIVRSGLPWAHFRTFGPTPESGRANTSAVRRYLADKQPKYVMLCSEGFLADAIGVRAHYFAQQSFGMRYIPVYQFETLDRGTFIIFRTEPVERPWQQRSAGP